MHATWGISIGTAGSAGAYVLGMVLADPLSTALVFIASFTAVATLGLVVVVGLNAWKDGHWWFVMKRLAHLAVPGSHRYVEEGRPCGSCNKAMTEIRFTWVCEACDHISVLV